MSVRDRVFGRVVARGVGWERGLRRALLDAMLPSPAERLPPLSERDLDPFWAKLAATAPIHLRVALPAASLLLGVLLPLGLGYRRTLASLPARQREAVLERASRLPLAAELVDVVKVVACLAYFDDPDVQRTVRGEAAARSSRAAGRTSGEEAR